MTLQISPEHAAIAIQKHLAPEFTPHLGLILGSGLGSIAESIQVALKFLMLKFQFSNCQCSGHKGQLVLAR